MEQPTIYCNQLSYKVMVINGGSLCPSTLHSLWHPTVFLQTSFRFLISKHICLEALHLASSRISSSKMMFPPSFPAFLSLSGLVPCMNHLRVSPNLSAFAMSSNLLFKKKLQDNKRGFPRISFHFRVTARFKWLEIGWCLGVWGHTQSAQPIRFWMRPGTKQRLTENWRSPLCHAQCSVLSSRSMSCRFSDSVEWAMDQGGT